MKQLGKIGVFLFSLMILMNVFAFINLELNGVYRFGGAIPAMITFGFSWFISYSKWANTNIWNKKTSKPNNTSDTSSDELVEPIDDNRDILSNINLPSLSGSNDDLKDALQKIEELKRQIEILEQSIKNNDSNSETESPELSEEELKEEEEKLKFLEELNDTEIDYGNLKSGINWFIVAILLILTIVGTIIYGTSN